MFSVATDTQLFAISTSKATEKVLNNLQQQEIYNIENSECYILYTGPTRQGGVEYCCRGCSDPNPDTNTSPWFYWRTTKDSDTYAVFTFLILVLKPGSYI